MLFITYELSMGTQSTVQPVPTRHRRHACIKMQTALSGNTRTWPIFSPADQGTFSKTAGQSQAYYNTWNWEWGTYDVTHLQILPCEVAVSMASNVSMGCIGPSCNVTDSNQPVLLQGWAGEMSPVATNGYFRCSEWSFLNIYITDILLLSPHVATWRPLAHLCIIDLITRGQC